MKILMASSEAIPYAKSGGLADVVSDLSHALVQRGHDVRIALPAYQGIIYNKPETLVQSAPVTWGIHETTSVQILSDQLKEVSCYFFSHPLFSNRPGIYGETSHQPYSDNNLRFSLYCQALFTLCQAIDWRPDIIHCHDWTTGLVPFFLKHSNQEKLSKTASVMTIHNLAYQGIFPRLDLHMFSLPPARVGADQHINMLRIGIEYADWITTVSPTYATEIQLPEFGFQLDTLLKQKSNHFSGILNGVDYAEWDPAADPYIPAPYTTDTLDDKQKNKQHLQEEAGLEVRRDVALISMVTRIAEQKGFIELLSNGGSALEEILKQLPVQVYIVGTGEASLERSLVELSKRYQNLSVHITFDNRLAHLAEAGSDFFLMPSRYEPCGLNQIYSLRYGTLPIVRNTGGLADTVEDIATDGETGTGFLFEYLRSESIFEAVHRAVQFWNDQKEAFRKAQIRAMNKDFSWNKSAQAYETVYTAIRRD